MNIVSLEMDVADVYTRKVFFVVRKQLRRQGLYYEVDKVDVGGHVLKYYLPNYNEPHRTWNVECQRDSGIYNCLCMKLESKGIPCCYILMVLILWHPEVNF